MGALTLSILILPFILLFHKFHIFKPPNLILLQSTFIQVYEHVNICFLDYFIYPCLTEAKTEFNIKGIPKRTIIGTNAIWKKSLGNKEFQEGMVNEEIKVGSFFNLQFVLKFYLLFYWCLQQMCSEHSLAFGVYWDFFYFSATYLVFPDLFLTSSLLLSVSHVWTIWNCVNGYLSFLASSWFCPLGSHSRGMEEGRRTKVGCLLPSYPPGFIASLLC